MSATGMAVATGITPSDTELVAGVRTGDDVAFEELYRRYQRRIWTFVRRVVRDDARAEDVTQEAFVSALRRLRATNSEIAFKPWIYEIARNAAIDNWRRSSRAEEVSINQDDLLRPGDRARLVGAAPPEASLIEKERIDHLRGALDELSQTHHRIIVMRELEGLSYREIGEQLELTRPAVESTLFRARRRLEREYEEIEAGRRCDAIGHVIARIAEGLESDGDRRRLSRHARRCSACRRRARQLGVEPLRSRRAAARAAALLPLPPFLRRRISAPPPAAADASFLGPLSAPAAHAGALLAERAAALVAAVAIAGAGGAVLSGVAEHARGSSGGGQHRGVATPGAGGTSGADGRTQPRTGSSAPLGGRPSGTGELGSPATGTNPSSRGESGHGAANTPPGGDLNAPAAPGVPDAPALSVSPPGLPPAPPPPDTGPTTSPLDGSSLSPETPSLPQLPVAAPTTTMPDATSPSLPDIGLPGF